MFKYLLYIQNPFVLGLIGGIIMVALQYWDDKRNNYEIVYGDYFKIFAYSFIVTTGLIYVSRFNISSITGMFGGGGGGGGGSATTGAVMAGTAAATGSLFRQSGRPEYGAGVRLDNDMYTGLSEF